jgi:uncharacterized membrane protein
MSVEVAFFCKNISLTPEIAIDKFEIFANGLDHPECLAFDRLATCRRAARRATFIFTHARHTKERPDMK